MQAPFPTWPGRPLLLVHELHWEASRTGVCVLVGVKVSAEAAVLVTSVLLQELVPAAWPQGWRRGPASLGRHQQNSLMGAVGA